MSEVFSSSMKKQNEGSPLLRDATRDDNCSFGWLNGSFGWLGSVRRERFVALARARRLRRGPQRRLHPAPTPQAGQRAFVVVLLMLLF